MNMKNETKRRKASIALGLAGALALGVIAPVATAAEATVSVGSLYEPVNLDNTAGGGQGVTEALNGNVYEGLFKLTDKGAVENLLATRVAKSADGLTYTVTIRPGLKFHSGDAVTSADVKYSVEKVTAAASKSARKNSFKPISGISTPSPLTVVFTLSAKSISFVYNLSYVWIVNSANKDAVIRADGTGPYKLASWQRGSTLSLVRNDAYWGTEAKTKNFVFRYYTSATALNSALLTKQIDIITSVQSPDSLEAFKKAGFTINKGASTTKLLMAFNNRVAPFNNVKVRRAIVSAIDNSKLLRSVWGEYGTLTGSMVPPKDPWYKDMTSINPYNPVLSKKLLVEAGYAQGFTFQLETPNYSPHPTAAAFIKSELAKVGITVNINVITNDTWYSKVFRALDFQVTLQEHVNDRDLVFYGNPNFYWGYNNPAVIKLVAESEAVDGTRLQAQLLRRVNRIVVKEAASDWLYLYPQIVVAASGVSGYPVNGLNSQFLAYNIVKD